MIIPIIKSIIYGIVEGLTEFLPISSTGHLILLDYFLKISENVEFTNIFEVFIQSGAILAVIFIYFKKLFPFDIGSNSHKENLTQLPKENKKENKEQDNKNLNNSGKNENKYLCKNININKDKIILWIFIIIACIPAIIFGYFFKNIIQQKLFNHLTVCITLFIYGIIILLIEKTAFIKRNSNNIAKAGNPLGLNFRKALLIGLFQVLAMIPGTSRSAATIIGGLIVGLSRENAAEFSFFLAIPTIIGASLLSIFDASITFGKEYFILLGIGFITSFFVALVVIKTFIKYIQKHYFSIFGWYRIILAVIFLFILIFK